MNGGSAHAQPSPAQQENRNDPNATLPRRLHRRFFYSLCSYGWPWLLTWAIAAAVFLSGCDDLDSYAADQASLADAIAQAAKEAGK
jgi:hypothetical protein